MPIFTIEQLQQPPVIETVELPEVQSGYAPPQIEQPIGQEIISVTEPTAIELYLGALARRVAIERINSENARRDDPNSDPINNYADQWFYEGLNRTFRDLNLENMFRATVDEQYATLKNPNS